MTEGQMRLGSEIKREHILPGDLVFFKIKKELHAGIMINKNDFIHASKTKGVTVDHIDLSYWKNSLLGFRSIL